MLDLQKKTLVFDFGNVLLNLDHKRCLDTFNNTLDVTWDINNYPERISKAIQAYEQGQITDDSFLQVFEQYNTQVKPKELIKAWNSILTDLPQARLDMLEALRSDYNLCLLSNINNLHHNWINTYLLNKLKIENFEQRFFDKVFYSHLIKKRKPNLNIYHHVSLECKVRLNDILFIDDMQINIAAAKKYGWKVMRHDPSDEISELITKYIKATWTKE